MAATGSKICSKCKAEKPVASFSVDRSKKDGLRTTCRDCAKATVAKWTAENPERKKLNDAAHHEKRYLIDADKERSRRKIWRENNPTYFRNYLEENRGSHNARVALRDAIKLKATPAWANTSAISVIYERARAISAETGIDHEVDHAVPLRSRHVCGLHCESNLRIITKAANRTKRNLYWPDMPERL
jgi:hypothetical protein